MTFQEKIPAGDVVEWASGNGYGEVIAQYAQDLAGGIERLKVQTEEGRGIEISEALGQAFPNAGFNVENVSTIGGAVSADIQRNALISVLLALVGILLYVAFR